MAVRTRQEPEGKSDLSRHMWGKVQQSNRMALFSLNRLEWALLNGGLPSLRVLATAGYGVSARHSNLWLIPEFTRLGCGRVAGGGGRLSHTPGASFITALYFTGPSIAKYLAPAITHGSGLFLCTITAITGRSTPKKVLNTPRLSAGPTPQVVAYCLKEIEASQLPAALEDRTSWFHSQLALTTARLSATQERVVAVDMLKTILATCKPGQELEHLQSLLRYVDYRGHDVRLNEEIVHTASQPFPYPAFAWKWKVVSAYPFAQAHHINLLEFTALYNNIRSLSLTLPKFIIIVCFTYWISESFAPSWRKDAPAVAGPTTLPGGSDLSSLQWTCACCLFGQCHLGWFVMEPVGSIRHTRNDEGLQEASCSQEATP